MTTKGTTEGQATDGDWVDGCELARYRQAMFETSIIESMKAQNERFAEIEKTYDPSLLEIIPMSTAPTVVVPAPRRISRAEVIDIVVRSIRVRFDCRDRIT